MILDAILSESVGSIFDLASESVEDLLKEALDRFDLSLYRAALEVRGIINQSAIQLKGVVDETLDELDDSQRMIMQDVIDLENKVNNDVEELIRELRSESNNIFSNIRLLISENPGALRILPSITIEGDSDILVQIRGSALSKAKIKEFRIHALPVEPIILKQDDLELNLKIPIDPDEIRNSIEENSGMPLEIPMSFSLVEYSWFELFETGRRPYKTTLNILPQTIGHARAIFSGEVEYTEYSGNKIGGPYISPRARSSLAGKAGRRTDVYHVAPTPGWQLHHESARIELKKLMRSCSSNRCSASFRKKSNHILEVVVNTVTDRKSKVNCKTETKIHYKEFKPSKKNETLVSKKIIVTTNNKVAFKLSDLNVLNLKKSRLAHIEVSSPLFKDERKIFRIEDGNESIKIIYDKASEIAYLEVGYV